MNINLVTEATNAVQPHQFEGYLELANRQLKYFYDQLFGYQGPLFTAPERASPEQIPEDVVLRTPVGSLTLRNLYAVDKGDICAWVVFMDSPPGCEAAERALFALHLSDRGWVDREGKEFVNRVGNLSIEAVIRRALAAKLVANTTYLQSVK